MGKCAYFRRELGKSQGRFLTSIFILGSALRTKIISRLNGERYYPSSPRSLNAVVSRSVSWLCFKSSSNAAISFRSVGTSLKETMPARSESIFAFFDLSSLNCDTFIVSPPHLSTPLVLLLFPRMSPASLTTYSLSFVLVLFPPLKNLVAFSHC